MRIQKYFIIFILSFSSLSASAWTIHSNFDSGELGTKADKNEDGFMGAGGGGIYSNETAIQGHSAKLHIKEGKTGYGMWGGEYMFPEKLHRGDTVWYQAHVYFPRGFDHYSYGEGNRLKFLRIATKSHDNNNHGYLDLYIDKKTSSYPFKWIYEGAARWVNVGEPSDMIVKDKWESYQMQITLDNVPKNSGGLAEVRIWKNGILLKHITDRITLKGSSDYSHRALLFTYWNGGAPQSQSMYVDNITITTEKPTNMDKEGNPRLRSLIFDRPKKLDSVTVK